MKHGAALAAVTASFVISRVAAYAAGVRFDASPLTWYWQFIDPPLLQSRLLESLAYSHAQPPLFNLALGLTLQLFPQSVETALHAQFLVLGWLAAIGLFVLLTELRVPVKASAALAILFSVWPPSLLYENWLFYEYPTMALLIWAAVALHRFVDRASAAAGVAFFLLAAAVVYTRSIFHVAWLLPIVAALMARLPARLVLRCAALPLLLICTLYGKNAVLFGVPGTSSWLGMHLARGTVAQLDAADRAALVGAGTLHGVSAIVPFSPLERYAGVAPPVRPSGIPLLDEPVKAGGSPNYHAAAYIPISQRYLSDSLWVVRHRLPTYFRTIRGSVMVLLTPSSDYRPLDVNRREIGTYAALWDWTYLRTRHFRGMSVSILAVYLLAGGLACRQLLRLRRTPGAPTADALTMLFMAYTCAFVATIGVLIESGENHRMRFMLDPLALAVIAAGVAGLARHRTTSGFSVVGEPQRSNQSMPSLTRSNFSV